MVKPPVPKQAGRPAGAVAPIEVAATTLTVHVPWPFGSEVIAR
jgi:hypothetical protein